MFLRPKSLPKHSAALTGEPNALVMGLTVHVGLPCLLCNFWNMMLSEAGSTQALEAELWAQSMSLGNIFLLISELQYCVFRFYPNLLKHVAICS